MAAIERIHEHSHIRQTRRNVARLLRRLANLAPGYSAPSRYSNSPLRALTTAALALPGMVGIAQADEDADVGIQYYHYQENMRDDYRLFNTSVQPPGSYANTYTGEIRRVPWEYRPVTSDGEHAYVHLRVDERTRMAFDYVQDIWSGASPIATQPASVTTGASPHLESHVAQFDAQGYPYYLSKYTPNANPNTPNGTPQELVYTRDTQLHQTMSYASPEIRKQANLSYGRDWNDASLDMGAGISDEPDFRSTFGSVSFRRNLNDKRTSVNVGLSYTHGDTHATWDTVYTHRQRTDAYPDQFATLSIGGGMNERRITGTRQDIALTAGVSQVVNKNDVFSTGFGFTRTTGFLANPYKFVTVFYVYPEIDTSLPSGIYNLGISPLQLEKRPSLRNQFTWDTGYLHFFEKFNAAGRLHYSLFADNWGVRAHTVDAEWRQTLGSAWTLTPRLRYYTQSAANFYAPYFFSSDQTGANSDLASHVFSSDERLSAFGTLSPGVTLTRQLAKGLSLEFALEYQKHAGSLRLGGASEATYADFHSYSASIGLRGRLDQLFSTAGGGAGNGSSNVVMDNDARHGGHHGAHGDAPAGVMAAHMLSVGETMVGYRFVRERQGGPLTQGSIALPPPSDGGPMKMVLTGTTMNMRMLEIMMAPSDGVTLMLMPSSVDMNMGMSMFGKAPMKMSLDKERDSQASGGWGDTGVYALFRLWERSGRHLHLSQGLSVPTGSVNVRSGEGPDGYMYSYDMQPGSGTWDYKPNLTYTEAGQTLSWGAQVSATKRLQGRNRSGYALGDEVQATAWGGLHIKPWLSATLRGQVTTRGVVKGEIAASLIPATIYGISDYTPQNYGGHFVDAGIGLHAAPISGALVGHDISVEWTQPLRSGYYGTQLQRKGALSASWSIAF
ncbi:MAG: DUF3570 domain-containing protein [Proteobacteria bacterium]|nr:DUF3570 domain-containing protein [Pseudomonadota bacterium]